MSLAQETLPFDDDVTITPLVSVDNIPTQHTTSDHSPSTRRVRARRNAPKPIAEIATSDTKMHLHKKGNPARMDRDVLRMIHSSLSAAQRFLTTRPKNGATSALWSPGHQLYARLALQKIDDLARNYFDDDQMALLEWTQKQVKTEADIRANNGQLPSARSNGIKALKGLVELLEYSLDILAVNADMRQTKDTEELGKQIGSMHDQPVALV